MKTLLYLLIAFLLMGCKGNKEKFTEFDFKLESFDWDSNPYKFSTYIQDSVIESKGHQIGAWDFSYIGNIERMHKLWDKQARNRKELSQNSKDSFALYERKNAIEYILNQAKNHQVVILNEGHHMPQHRIFTTRLLDGLKEQDFKHLGLETYFASPKTDSILQTKRYPTLKSGYYTKEPQFGNLIRVAHQDGFRIFGYESEDHESAKEREINQAKNIKNYIENYPSEKILIHCGFDHGYEGELSNQLEKAMAGRLAEFTGINPLTINQVIYSERSKKRYENPYYQLSDIDEPSVFIYENGTLFGEYRHGGWFDISVFHPRSREFNRPEWLKYDDRSEVEYSFEEAEIECPCLVFAYKKGEEIGSAVPYDIQETGTKKARLILEKSDFEIVIWNQKGRALKSDLENRN